MKSYLIALVVLLSLPSLAQAGSYSGKIDIIQAGIEEYNGTVFIKMDGTFTNMPECSNNTSWQFAFDGRTETGKTFLDILLTAYATDSTVALYGKNECTHWSSVEDLDIINIR